MNFNYAANPANDLPVTLTSTDPSRLLVSADPTQLGTASATVAYSDGSKLTLQALDDHGAVTLTASIPNFAPP